MKLALSRRVWILSTLLLCIALDQWTKVLAQEHIRGQLPRTYWNNFFRFEYSENRGAFLSLGAGLSESMRFWLLVVAVAIVLVVGLYALFFRRMPAIGTAGLTFAIAGGLSNLIDRVFRENGAVVDFMNMGIGGLRTGIFNVADMAIMLGIGLLLVPQKAETETTRPEPAPAK
ncbi:MAG: signal peptidase II [Bacteriovoracia bacterium]